MEYKIFNIIRNRIKIPYFIRIIIWVTLVTVWALLWSIPIIPWFIPATIWLLLLVPGKSIKIVIKLRKGLSHLVTNLNKWKVVRHKFFDLISHVKQLFKSRK